DDEGGRPPLPGRAPARRARRALRAGLPDGVRDVGLARQAEGEPRQVVPANRPAGGGAVEGPQADGAEQGRAGRLLHGVRPDAGDGGPFGAVVVRDGVIVAEGWNRVLVAHDPTAHAEVEAVRAAGKVLGTHDLTGCEIFASCEPCPMCLAAILWARLDRLYYA